VSHRLVVLALAVFVLSCGGKKDSDGSGGNPLNPTGNFGGLGDAKGRIIATINGTAHTFGVPTGGTFQSNAANPALNVMTLSGTTANLDRQITFGIGNTLIRSVSFGVNPATGTPFLDPANGFPVNFSVNYSVHPGGVLTGSWFSTLLGGSGTFQISTLTAAASTGAFSGTLAPTPGTGAIGNVNLTSGQYNITF
jgi:hypothetical protein